MKMNGSGGAPLYTPGQIRLKINEISNGNASPAVVPIGANGEMQLFVVGGLSKLETLAGQIATGLLAGEHGSADALDGQRRLISSAIEIAARILDATSRLEGGEDVELEE